MSVSDWMETRWMILETAGNINDDSGGMRIHTEIVSLTELSLSFIMTKGISQFCFFFNSLVLIFSSNLT